ncbi:hypothetical protein Tco_0088564 [Tanacetum coccineum]
MIETEKPLKKKDQVLIDEEIAQKLQAQLNAELEEEEKLAKQREEDANIAKWDNVQAMIDADYELAAFDKTMGWIESFVSMDSKVVKGGKEKDEGSATRAEESSSKRAGTELEQERIKKQKIDDDQEEAEMKKHMEIVVNEEDIAVDAIPLATKPPIINIDSEDLETLWKLVKAKHRNTRPEEAYERVLWGDLKVMFEPDVESKDQDKEKGIKMKICLSDYLRDKYESREEEVVKRYV